MDWTNADRGDGPPRKIAKQELPSTFTPLFRWAFALDFGVFSLSAETRPTHNPTATQKPRRDNGRSTQREAGTLPHQPGLSGETDPAQVRCHAPKFGLSLVAATCQVRCRHGLILSGETQKWKQRTIDC
jgi:hypothetical protein